MYDVLSKEEKHALSGKLVGTTECTTLYPRCRTNRGRYNRIQLWFNRSGKQYRMLGRCGLRRNRQRSVARYGVYIGRPNKSTKILSADTCQAKSQTKQTYRYTRMTSVELRLVFFHEDSNT